MPLSGGGGAIPAEILEQLAKSVGGGAPNFPYSKAGQVELTGERQQVLPPVENNTREIFIRNTSDKPITLYLGSQNVKMATLSPGQYLWDTSNSGYPIEVVGTGEIEIIARSDQPINYEIGQAMTFPVGVMLRIGTGNNFQFVSETIQDSTSSTFDLNVRKFLDSEDGITGHKLVIIDTFTPGGEIKFNVQINGNRYDSTQGIQFQWINQIKLFRVLAAVASDVINPESQEIADSLPGLITQGGFAGEIPGTGGELILKPNFLNLMGRFVAVDSQTSYYDTAIVTDYTPNADPLLGGTFTLEGF
jgi:hypothetical protein